MMKEIFKTLRTLISEQTGIEEAQIKPASHFADDLNLEPLEVSDLLLSVEEKFGLDNLGIRPDEVGTVADLVNIISDKQNEL